MTISKAMILGCAGTSLTEDEIRFYRDERPWGFILFARNISEPQQIKDLTAAMRDAVGRPDALVFIDQEGGRVQRLRPPLAPNYPAAMTIGEISRDDPKAAARAAWLVSRLHAFDLRKLGVTANCLPVLDVPVEGANDVIGSRAYGKTPSIVAEMGAEVARGLMSGGVLPVMKHMPGHGRALCDTHLALPTVDAPLDELRRHDFAPFKALNYLPMGMTAHVIYSAIDPTAPATTSAKVVKEIIRDEIGFDGLLMSDDTSMKALSGDYRSKSASILAAGVDIVLHCNGVMEEMTGIAAGARELGHDALRRADAVLALASELAAQPDGAVEMELRAEAQGWFEAVV